MTNIMDLSPRRAGNLNEKISYRFTLLLLVIFSLNTNAQTTFTSVFSSDGNSTGAEQNPLSLGNWANSTSTPQYKIFTYDAGYSLLRIHSTRWVGGLFVTREGSTGLKNIMDLNGYDGLGSIMNLYDENNQVKAQIKGLGDSYFNGGNLGIGTSTPQAKLDVHGQQEINTTYDAPITFRRANASWQYMQFYTAGSRKAWMGLDDVNDFCIYKENGGVISFRGANVGIGTKDTKGYQLAVDGHAIFTKVVVKPTGAWPDYVFNKKYELLPLAELEKFIQKNSHLPEVPSATDIEKDGLDLGNTQATLLKKIEELTLYVIDQNKRMESSRLKLTF